jgi:hypothetical protein
MPLPVWVRKFRRLKFSQAYRSKKKGAGLPGATAAMFATVHVPANTAAQNRAVTPGFSVGNVIDVIY